MEPTSVVDAWSFSRVEWNDLMKLQQWLQNERKEEECEEKQATHQPELFQQFTIVWHVA